MKNISRVFTLIMLLLPGYLIAQSTALSDVLTLQEAAKLLRTDAGTVRLMAEAQTIPGQRLTNGSESGAWRFSREALMAWLEKRGTGRLESGGQDAPEEIPDAEIGERPREKSAAEMFLQDQSVLLQENELSLDVGVFYTRRDTALSVSAASPTQLTLESRSAVLQSIVRYSFIEDLEFYLRASGVSESAQLFANGAKIGSSSSQSQGDIDIGLRYVLADEAVGRPEVVLGLERQVETGQSSPAWGGSVALLKSLDPAVLFGSVAYQHTDSRDFREIALLEPERQVTLTLGYAFALNDALSLNTSVFTVYQSRSRFSRAELRKNDFSGLQLGLTAKVARGVYLQPVVSFGLSGTDSVFTLGLNVPMSFTNPRD